MDRTRSLGTKVIKRFVGREMEEILPELAALRIQIFRDYPYLYEGDFEYEKKYLKRYSRSEMGFLAALYDQDCLIGAATALPLLDEEDFVRRPFQEQSWPLESVFYFGESVLLPKYRGQGLGHIFFDERERFALQNSHFRWTSFCAVVRPESHPAKPVNYRSLNEFWKKRGYEPVPALKSEFSWADLGSTIETAKPMQFWIRDWSK